MILSFFTAINPKTENTEIMQTGNNQFNYRYSVAAGYRAAGNITVWQGLFTAVASGGVMSVVTQVR